MTGYNLSYSMGVSFDRILEGFDGPFETLPGIVSPPPGRVASAPAGGGYVIGAETNDAFVALNRLLKANEEVYRLRNGAFFVPAKPSVLPILQRLATERGLSAGGYATPPAGDATRLRPMRVGLWDQYGGSMPSGWTRWLLEQFEFPFEVVYQKGLDAGNLANRFDVLIFVDGAFPAREAAAGAQPPPDRIPLEYRDHLGAVSSARTVPELKRFVEAGGTLIAIGSSTSLGRDFGLPIRSALVERAGGAESPLSEDKFFVPGSILEARVDRSHPLAAGLRDRVNVFFDHSEAFRLLPEAAQRGVKAVAWFDGPAPLRSGWAWGQQYLDQAVQVVDAPLGKGRVVLFGPEIAWRAQPHGTFKFLFNGIFLGSGPQATGSR